MEEFSFRIDDDDDDDLHVSLCDTYVGRFAYLRIVIVSAESACDRLPHKMYHIINQSTECLLFLKLDGGLVSHGDNVTM